MQTSAVGFELEMLVEAEGDHADHLTTTTTTALRRRNEIYLMNFQT